MTFDPIRLVRDHIRQVDAYQPVVPFEVLAAEQGLSPGEIVKLDANENPYGPLPAVFDALATLPYAHIYPDPESRSLRAALASYTGVPAESIVAGAGADELIDLIMRLYLNPGDAIVNCPPTFGMYPFDAQIQDARVIPVPRREDFSLDLEGIEAVVESDRPKLIFLASPNNPDGGLLPVKSVARLLDLPWVVVLDEAYIEFAGSEGGLLHWVTQKENLIVLRTFSKWAGLAGLRVGYGAFPASVLPHVWKIKQPYNVSQAASVAARVSLDHLSELNTICDRIIAERDRLYTALRSVPYLEPIPSQANFILCRVIGREAAALKGSLARRGIFIRYFDKPGLRNFVRISVGAPGHTDRLLAALLDDEL